MMRAVLRPAQAPSRPTADRCGACRFFCNDPLWLEQASAGLAVLSSGFAAVRAGDGLCGSHGRYVSIGSGCARHTPNEPVGC